LIVDAFFAYFLCVCYNYSDARAAPDAPKEEGVKAPELPKIGGCCSCCGDDKPEEKEVEGEKKWCQSQLFFMTNEIDEILYDLSYFVNLF
jgi:hypothetical protein